MQPSSVVTCHVMHLEQRCRERGRYWGEVEPCIVARRGDIIDVDTSHPSYPSAARSPAPPAHSTPAGGPGTELSKMLSRIGITAKPNCSCKAHAKQMDEWGPDVCEQRMPEILGWLEHQANARKLPFSRFVAEQVVRMAIRRARKSRSQPPTGT